MRWSYFVPRLLLLSLLWAFLTFGFDPLLCRAIMNGTERVVRAKVDVNAFVSSFTPPTVMLRDVHIARPGARQKNLVEFQELKLQLETPALLQGNLVVGTGTISGLRWGTNRNDPGRIDHIDWPFDEALKLLKDRIRGIQSESWEQLARQANLVLDPRDLESVRTAEHLHAVWTARFEDLEHRIELLKTRVEQIEDRVKSARGNVLEQIAAYRDAAAQTNELLIELRTIRTELAELEPAAQNDLRTLDAARRRDAESVQQAIKLIHFDPQALTELLLGPELSEQFFLVVDYTRRGVECIQAANSDFDPERSRGIDVQFPVHNPTPKFLVRSLDVSGEATIEEWTIPFRGNLSGLTSQPDIYGKPMVLRIEGRGEAGMKLEASIDLTGDVPVSSIDMAYSSQTPFQTTIGDSDLVQLDITANTTEWRAHVGIVGDQVDGEFWVLNEPVTLTSTVHSGADPRLAALIQGVVGQVHRLQARLVFHRSQEDGPFDSPQWTLESNLGPELASALNRVLAGEIEGRRQELAAAVNGAAGEQEQRLRSLLNDRFVQLTEGLNWNESHARQLIQGVAGQPLDPRNLLRR